MGSLSDILGDLSSKISSNPRASSTADAVGLSSNSRSSIKARHSRILPEYACTISCPDLGISVVAQMPEEINWSAEASYDTPMRDILGDTIRQLPMVGNALSGATRFAGFSMVTQTMTAKIWGGSSTSSIPLRLIFQAESDELAEVMEPVAKLLMLTMPRNSGGDGSFLQAPSTRIDLGGMANDGVSAASSSATKSVAGVNTLSSALRFGSDLSGRIGGSIKEITGVLTDKKSGKEAFDAAVSGIGKAADSAATSLHKTVGKYVKNPVTITLGTMFRFEPVVVTNVSLAVANSPVGSSYGKSTGNTQRIEVDFTFEPFYDLTQDDLPKIFMNPKLSKAISALLNKNKNAQPSK